MTDGLLMVYNGFLAFIMTTLYLLLPGNATALEKHIRLATYNVENLFDIKVSGREYAAYIPGNRYGWNEGTYRKKLENIAEVICGIAPDILAIQEVETSEALLALKDELKAKGYHYPYYRIAGAGPSVVHCALLSRYPLTGSVEHISGNMSRAVLKVTVHIETIELVVFINHWSSPRHPESRRILEAGVLRESINALKPHTDYVVLGDFNSGDVSGADKRGRPNVTGFNDVLKTVLQLPVWGRKKDASGTDSGLLYNLWVEKKPADRWSYIYAGTHKTPDHILIPDALFDLKGVDYIPNTFSVYRPRPLIRSGRVYRWQRNEKGAHTGNGYSDHLPLYADFKVLPGGRL